MSAIKPESQRQAQRWDAWAGQYRRALGCDGCAAQASWGRALGWMRVRPPCARCTLVVETWSGRDVGNGWRVFGTEPASALSLTVSAVRESSDLIEPTRLVTGAEEAA